MWKHGGTWEGIVPQLLEQLQEDRRRPAPAAARKVHARHALPDLPGPSPQSAGPRRARRRQDAGRSGGDAARRFGRSGLTPSSGALETSLDPVQRTIATEVLKEIRGRVQFLLNVGLHYLTLDRSRPDALRRRGAAHSSGRADRLRPGRRPLHPRRTVDRPASRATTIACCAASNGCATWATPSSSSSTTKTRCGRPTTSSISVPVPACAAARWSRPAPIARRRQESDEPDRPIPLRQADHRHPARAPATLPIARSPSSAPATTTSRTSTSSIPLGLFVCVTGVSGSGKSSLINDILMEGLLAQLRGAGERRGRRTRTSAEAAVTIGAARPHRRAGADRQGHRHRPVADRPHAALATRRPTSRSSTRSATCYAQMPEAQDPRLQAGPLQLQQAGRPLRGVRGQRLESPGDGFPRRRLGDVSGVRGPSLQPRDAANSLQGQEHPRRPGNGRRRRRWSTSRTSPRSARCCKRCTTSASITSSSASPPLPCPAARPSASSWPANCAAAAPARRSTSSTSRPPACTSTTSASCCKCCTVSSRPATRWSSSSTTST